jgi:prephenate dehydratase
MTTDPCHPVDAAYQGAAGAFSEEAARAFFGPAATLTPQPTLADVFDALVEGRARHAVVPVENTLAGPVPGYLDLVERHPVRILAERVQPISHALIVMPGVEASAVRRVLSHPVALAQCERFLRAHPGMTPVPVFDTAGAVAEVVRLGVTDAAAIASRRAADLYGATVLAEAIQDEADNFTRFAVLARGMDDTVLREGCKTSLVCVLRNEPGALARALQPFAERGVNLCRIESRPIPERPFEYRFYLDLSPVPEVNDLRAALMCLGSCASSLRILGHYPVP